MYTLSYPLCTYETKSIFPDVKGLQFHRIPIRL